MIEASYIGVGPDGSTGAGNTADGILVSSGGNRIGGPSATQRNVISDNGNDVDFGAGIVIAGGPAGGGNTVEGNYIGTTAAGTVALGNYAQGIAVQDSDGNTIAGNVISGTVATGVGGPSGAGIDLHSTSTANVVRGNKIGTDHTGSVDLGNGKRGILLNGAPGNTIGGAASGAGNVISGNNGDGILISSSADVIVEGNLIGTDAAGTAALGNTDFGVQVSASANAAIGGVAAGAGNVISANATGVAVANGSSGASLEGNAIGTDEAGAATGIGNASHGVLILNTSGNTIGGTAAGAGNTIARNGGDGVFVNAPVSAATANAIEGNSIASNTGLGIDLAPDGPRATTAATETAARTTSRTSRADERDGRRVYLGVRHARHPPGTYRVEFFANPTCDTGNVEGERYLGFTAVPDHRSLRAVSARPPPERA